MISTTFEQGIVMLELMLICLLIGFVLGYYSKRWSWTASISAKLDKLFPEKSEKKDS